MTISVFDMFNVGIGPSSSHALGPMRAARRFVDRRRADGLLPRIEALRVEFFGSLGQTGKGHGSDRAVLLGLLGELPDTVEPDHIEALLAPVHATGRLRLFDGPEVALRPQRDIVFHRRERLPMHPNGMRFVALDASGAELRRAEYYSVGGGFVVGADAQADEPVLDRGVTLRHPFQSADELLATCRAQGVGIAEVMLRNETAWRSPEEVRAKLLGIWGVMQACARRGMEREGVLPGGLKVRRRAAAMHRRLLEDRRDTADALVAMDWVNLHALAVNEENAAGGRVVTAPTNGAAGVIPAVLHYYTRFAPGADDAGVVRFLLVAGAIAILYKINASISGAEVGCQGEVGVACSMAAGGLAEVLGGTPEQVENAAEIGMEHNLGLTCDPVGGLVQVPCIERNAMGAVKAINAARLALQGDGVHHISLDRVIRTMRQTGADMKTKYKETARGGLAVNIVEC